MNKNEKITQNVDLLAVLLYSMCVIAGWLNIFSTVYEPDIHRSLFDLSVNSGKQLIWIVGAVIIIISILAIDYKAYDTLAYVIYGAVVLLLLAVLIFGREVAGSKSWFEIGSFRLQPSEFAKFASALAMAKYLGNSQIKVEKLRTQLILAGILGLPVGLILLQGDAGSAMVFSVFILVLYREGLSPWVLIAGALFIIVFVFTLILPPNYLIGGILIVGVIIIIFFKKTFKKIALVIGSAILAVGLVIGIHYVFFDTDKLLKPHQRDRIKVLMDVDAVDPTGRGVSYNLRQSKIAIGSGGFIGKGFLEGTQTKLKYVPEQSTDFIFCTIGEEQGWIGTLALISLYLALLTRIVLIAERQKDRFIRVYGYCVAAILFFHFAVNIAMTIGLFPVIGIPLPFISYGGSSLWSFTILLFILLKLDSHRKQMLARG